MARHGGLNLSRVFAHAIVRRLAYVLVALVLAWVGIGRAEAQTAPAAPSPPPRTQETALRECEAWASYSTAVYNSASIKYACTRNTSRGLPAGTTLGSYDCKRTSTSTSPGSPCLQYSSHDWQTACPTGTTWSDMEKRCVEARCKAGEKRAAGIMVVGAAPSQVCTRDNCKATLDAGDNQRTVTDAKKSNALSTKNYNYTLTGEECSAADQPEPKTDYCHDVGGGFSMCPGKNGTCVMRNSTGKKYCPAENTNSTSTDGTRTDSVVAAPEGGLPTGPQPKTGEDWNNNGPIGTGQNGNGVTNYFNFVNNGTGGNGGTGPDPGPGEGDGDGDGEGDQGSVGGGTCGAGYTCSGDVIACAQLQEMNRQRCALEEGPGDGELAGGEDGMGDGVGKLFGGDGGMGNVMDVLGNYLGGAPSCPQNPEIAAFGKTITLPLDQICPHLQLMGTLMLGFAYLFAVKMMLE